MEEFNEAYLDEVKKDLLRKIEKIKVYTESRDVKKIINSAETLAKQERPSLNARAGSIFASRLLLTAVIEKMREGKEGKKQMELERIAYDFKELSMAGAHGGPIVGLIAYLTRKLTDIFTGERIFKEKVGKLALKTLESARISEEYEGELRKIIKERVKRTF
ncbi:MAG: hypothetical protein U9N35_07050 [Euryarchaeota archaeon]|nr:hypothetical protein [Euryarchaeota archaeon]